MLEDGDVDIDVNSHVPWFNDQVATNHFKQTFVETVFLTPTGLYSDKIKTLADLPDGAKIAISEDVPNQARSLGFLQSAGLITLTPGHELSTVTLDDIATNPKNLQWVQVDLEATPRTLPDVDGAVILGTVATAAGLKLDDALAKEPANNPLWAIGVVARTEDVSKPEYKKGIRDVQLRRGAPVHHADVPRGPSHPGVRCPSRGDYGSLTSRCCRFGRATTTASCVRGG